MWSVETRLWIVTTAFLNIPIGKVFGPGSYPGCHWVRYPLLVQYGVCSSVGRALDCGSRGRGFDPHRTHKR
jgi:hypothetical protein